MNLNQLSSLTDDEIALALVILNEINNEGIPKIEYHPRYLTWFKHDALIRRFLGAFPRILPEGHETFKSLLSKMNVNIEIKKVDSSVPAKIESSGSI